MVLVININPVPAPRMTQADRWKKRPCVLRYFLYKDALRTATKDIEIRSTYKLTFVIPFPKSYSNKKRASLLNQPHEEKPDIDNLIKAFQDALLTEDKAIHSITVNKIWGHEGKIILYDYS